MELLIKNGTIVRANEMFRGSLGIDNEKISAIFHEGDLLPEANRVIDASGKLIFPGFIDAHVHMNEPGHPEREDILHATRAAALGGITTVIDMPNTNVPPTHNIKEIEVKKEKISQSAVVDVALWGALVNYNFDELEQMAENGVCVFKSFLCNPGPTYTNLNEEELVQALSIIHKFNGVAGFHCEDDTIINRLITEKKKVGKETRKDYLDTRPVEAELKAVKTIINAVRNTGCASYICHISHPDVVDVVKKAREEGLEIYAESGPHYLLFSEEDYLREGGRFKCCPPLRSDNCREKLVAMVAAGDIHVLGSDHCPFPAQEKDESIYGCIDTACGMAGIQSIVQATYDEFVNKRNYLPMIITAVFSTNPAKIFGLYGKKGDIAIGFDGDITIVDPELDWTVNPEELAYIHKCSAYDGLKGKGKPVFTILKGDIVMEYGVILQEQKGNFVACSRGEHNYLY